MSFPTQEERNKVWRLYLAKYGDYPHFSWREMLTRFMAIIACLTISLLSALRHHWIFMLIFVISAIFNGADFTEWLYQIERKISNGVHHRS